MNTIVVSMIQLVNCWSYGHLSYAIINRGPTLSWTCKLGPLNEATCFNCFKPSQGRSNRMYRQAPRPKNIPKGVSVMGLSMISISPIHIYIYLYIYICMYIYIYVYVYNIDSRFPSQDLFCRACSGNPVAPSKRKLVMGELR